MMTNDLIGGKSGFIGPTFTFRNRLRRLVASIVWLVFARWTPAPAHKWRVLVLRVLGARVSWKAYVYPDVKIWAPWNLEMEAYATLARHVTCYNIAPVFLGARAVVSQGAHICTGSHDYRVPDFPLIAKPIYIGKRSWVCADTFIGPGVTVEEGAVLAGASVTFQDLDSWTVYSGNPARSFKSRPRIEDQDGV